MRALSFVTDLLRLHAGRVVQPRFVTWAVTLRCNATCGACDSWRLPPRQELTPQQAGALFADLGPLDAVRLTGGEPTLRADLPALADAVRRASNPAVLHLTTHGGFPDRVLAFAEGYAEPKRLRILVSLDGLEAEHDRSRGHAVSFERAMTTIRGLVGLRRRGLQISVNHTVVTRTSRPKGAGRRGAASLPGPSSLMAAGYRPNRGRWGAPRTRPSSRGRRRPTSAPAWPPPRSRRWPASRPAAAPPPRR